MIKLFPSLNIRNITFVTLLILAAPKAYFELGNNSDSAIRLVQNHLFHELISGSSVFSVVPHGPLSFLQYPINIGANYLIFFGFQFVLSTLILAVFYKRKLPLSLLSFLIIYLAIGQRFMIFTLFIILLFNFQKPHPWLALLLVIIQFNIRLPMAIIMASLWPIGVLRLSQSIWQHTILIITGYFLMAISYLWYPFFLGNGIKDVLLIFSNNNLLLKNTAAPLTFIPIIVSITAVYYLRMIKVISFSNYTLSALIITSILGSTYFISRPEYGTFYVIYNLVFSILILIALNQQRPIFHKLIAIFSFSLIFNSISLITYDKGIKITKPDTLYAWKTAFNTTKNESNQFTFKTAKDKGITVYPWNQNIKTHFQKRISPYYISYCAMDSTFDMENWKTIGDTLLIHSACYNCSDLAKNDVNGLYIGFANGFFISGVVKNFKILVTNRYYTIYIRDVSKKKSNEFSLCSYSANEFMNGVNLNSSEECDLIKLSNPQTLRGNQVDVIMRLESGMEIRKPINKKLLAKGVYLDRFLFDHNYTKNSERIVSVRFWKSPA